MEKGPTSLEAIANAIRPRKIVDSENLPFFEEGDPYF